MTRLVIFTVFFAMMSGQGAAHPAPYGHTHVTPEQCAAAEATGLFRCIRPRIETGKDGPSQRQNRMVRDIANRLGLDRWEQRMLHDEISGLDLTYDEILQLARDMFGK